MGHWIISALVGDLGKKVVLTINKGLPYLVVGKNLYGAIAGRGNIYFFQLFPSKMAMALWKLLFTGISTWGPWDLSVKR
jgi:hypothetical protein